MSTNSQFRRPMPVPAGQEVQQERPDTLVGFFNCSLPTVDGKNIPFGENGLKLEVGKAATLKIQAMITEHGREKACEILLKNMVASIWLVGDKPIEREFAF